MHWPHSTLPRHAQPSSRGIVHTVECANATAQSSRAAGQLGAAHPCGKGASGSTCELGLAFQSPGSFSDPRHTVCRHHLSTQTTCSMEERKGKAWVFHHPSASTEAPHCHFAATAVVGRSCCSTLGHKRPLTLEVKCLPGSRIAGRWRSPVLCTVAQDPGCGAPPEAAFSPLPSTPL